MSERPTPALHIVPKVPAHLPEMIDLWVAGWSATLPAIDFEARRGFIVDHLAALEAAGAATRLAFDAGNGTLAGFVVVDPATGYLDQLAVSPTWWGSGVAAALLAEARRLSPAGLLLDVNRDNPRAVRFYEREGFQRTGESTNPRSGLPIWRYEWQVGT
ncbi:GNAT family N-acetyltransferase [Ancylobacter terrae]|uniref:GNAT family N-acetyltransferase n=1 Tax=Ancylobacter sp. sgz301288 TaxID=3342077 RepID=UPI00385EBD57